MSSPEEVQQNLQDAKGRFEYSVDGEALILPAYKYVYFDYDNRIPLIFIGRDTSGPIRETGIAITFSEPSFWGDKVSLGDGVAVRYFRLATDYKVLSGSFTGVAEGAGKSGFVEFEFAVDYQGGHRQIKGMFLLKAGGVIS